MTGLVTSLQSRSSDVSYNAAIDFYTLQPPWIVVYYIYKDSWWKSQIISEDFEKKENNAEDARWVRSSNNLLSHRFFRDISRANKENSHSGAGDATTYVADGEPRNTYKLLLNSIYVQLRVPAHSANKSNVWITPAGRPLNDFLTEDLNITKKCF